MKRVRETKELNKELDNRLILRRNRRNTGRKKDEKARKRKIIQLLSFFLSFEEKE